MFEYSIMLSIQVPVATTAALPVDINVVDINNSSGRPLTETKCYSSESTENHVLIYYWVF